MVLDSTLSQVLEELMEPYTSVHPMRSLRWTCKSTTQLAIELNRQGHRISADTVGRLLKANGYSLQGNRKRFEGQEWTPQGQPLEVEAYDFIDADRGKAIPYGIYDPSHNLGWVSVGTVQRTA